MGHRANKERRRITFELSDDNFPSTASETNSSTRKVADASAGALTPVNTALAPAVNGNSAVASALGVACGGSFSTPGVGVISLCGTKSTIASSPLSSPTSGVPSDLYVAAAEPLASIMGVDGHIVSPSVGGFPALANLFRRCNTQQHSPPDTGVGSSMPPSSAPSSVCGFHLNFKSPPFPSSCAPLPSSTSGCSVVNSHSHCEASERLMSQLTTVFPNISIEFLGGASEKGHPADLTTQSAGTDKLPPSSSSPLSAISAFGKPKGSKRKTSAIATAPQQQATLACGETLATLHDGLYESNAAVSPMDPPTGGSTATVGVSENIRHEGSRPTAKGSSRTFLSAAANALPPSIEANVVWPLTAAVSQRKAQAMCNSLSAAAAEPAAEGIRSTSAKKRPREWELGAVIEDPNGCDVGGDDFEEAFGSTLASGVGYLSFNGASVASLVPNMYRAELPPLPLPALCLHTQRIRWAINNLCPPFTATTGTASSPLNPTPRDPSVSASSKATCTCTLGVTAGTADGPSLPALSTLWDAMAARRQSRRPLHAAHPSSSFPKAVSSFDTLPSPSAAAVASTKTLPSDSSDAQGARTAAESNHSNQISKAKKKAAASAKKGSSGNAVVVRCCTPPPPPVAVWPPALSALFSSASHFCCFDGAPPPSPEPNVAEAAAALRRLVPSNTELPSIDIGAHTEALPANELHEVLLCASSASPQRHGETVDADAVGGNCTVMSLKATATPPLLPFPLPTAPSPTSPPTAAELAEAARATAEEQLLCGWSASFAAPSVRRLSRGQNEEGDEDEEGNGDDDTDRGDSDNAWWPSSKAFGCRSSDTDDGSCSGSECSEENHQVDYDSSQHSKHALSAMLLGGETRCLADNAESGLAGALPPCPYGGLLSSRLARFCPCVACCLSEAITDHRLSKYHQSETETLTLSREVLSAAVVLLLCESTSASARAGVSTPLFSISN